MKEKMKKKEYIRFDRTPFKPLTKEEKEMEKIGVLLLIDSLKVKGKDNMKEKIEDKLQNYKDCGFELTDYETVDMVYTLIQAERKEAVEGFVDNIGWKKPSEVIDLADDVIDGRSLVKQMEAYLQSLDKGDTDENR